jgi:hypothetical protein
MDAINNRELRKATRFTSSIVRNFGSTGFNTITSNEDKHYISHEMQWGMLHFMWVEGDSFVTVRLPDGDYTMEIT